MLTPAAILYLVSETERVDKANEALLNNVFPKSIVSQLKSDQATIADGFESASILFADLAGFTPVAEKLTPNELVLMLNSVLSLSGDPTREA